MAKVFRLFEQNIEHEDWQEINEPYGSTVIESIENPDGDKLKEGKTPTSIPSPFARIDLIRSAFEYVVAKDNADLNGETVYHKLVSDCFDLAWLFFSLDTLRDRVKIRAWDKKTDLPILLNSTNEKHKLYGETLDLFLKQDSKSNNFDALDKFYFMFIDNKIVGGTSPTTLFFTSANDLSFAQIDIGNDITFDDDYAPLHEREEEFQEYIYTLFYAYPELRTRMSDMFDYLEKNKAYLDTSKPALFNKINDIEETGLTRDVLNEFVQRLDEFDIICN